MPKQQQSQRLFIVIMSHQLDLPVEVKTIVHRASFQVDKTNKGPIRKINASTRALPCRFNNELTWLIQLRLNNVC